MQMKILLLWWLEIKVIWNISEVLDLRKHRDSLKLIVILVNNTIDISFMETSALNASNVDSAFKQIVTDIYKLTLEGKFDYGIGGIRGG